MERWTAVAFIFAGFLRVAGAQTTLTVRIYNSAHLNVNTVYKAREEAAYIVDSAGFRTVWVTCTGPGDCPDPPSTSDVVVRLAPDSVFPKKDTAYGAILGRSVMGHGRQPDYVEVFCAAIQKLVTDLAVASTGEVIGAVIAHEVGHLYLGPRHSLSGLMNARWGPQELSLLERRKLKFNRFEKAKLKRELVLRGAPRLQEGSVIARNRNVWR